MLISRRALLSLLPAAALLPRAVPALRLFIGTGAGSGSLGIYEAEFHPGDGSMSSPVLALALPSPTFLALAPHTARLYTLAEGAGGGVSACRIGAGGTLTLENRQPSLGDGPTHLSVHPSGRAVFVTNYTGGSVTSYAVGADGALSAPVSHFVYTEAGKTSHAHCVTPSPDGGWLLVSDLGLDRIVVYRVDPATAVLTPATPPFWSARAGAGPRHTAFHPNGRWVYSVNELDSTVDHLGWDAAAGRLQTIGGPVSTLQASRPSHTAFASEILVSPDGRFVYAGNRRDETVAVLAVEPSTGAPRLIQTAPHGGKTARHLTLDPTGGWLLAADQDSGGVAVLRRDAATGMLSGPVGTTALGSPQCLVFGRA